MGALCCWVEADATVLLHHTAAGAPFVQVTAPIAHGSDRTRSIALCCCRAARQLRCATLQRILNAVVRFSYSLLARMVLYISSSADAGTKTLRQRHTNSMYLWLLLQGAILVFLPGWDDITRQTDCLQRHSYFARRELFRIVQLHRCVPRSCSCLQLQHAALPAALSCFNEHCCAACFSICTWTSWWCQASAVQHALSSRRCRGARVRLSRV